MKIQAQTNPRLLSLKEAMDLQRPEMAIIRDRLDTRFRQLERTLFKTQGASGGRKWPRLSRRYAKVKPKRCKGRKKIMVCTGKLRAGLTQRNHPDHVRDFTLKPEPAVELGTKNKVAAYHSGGIPGNRLKNPALPDRDVIALTDAQGRQLLAIWADYLVNEKLARIFRILQAWPRSLRRLA